MNCGRHLVDKNKGAIWCNEKCRNQYRRKHKKGNLGTVLQKPELKKPVSDQEKTGLNRSDDQEKNRVFQVNDINNQQNKPQLKEETHMSENTSGFDYYKARFEELSKSYDKFEARQEEIQKKLQAKIDSQENELKAAEKENTRLTRELAIINDKHNLELQRTSIESTSTLGGVIKDMARPENLETVLGIIGAIKELRSSKKEDQSGSLVLSGDPKKDELISNMIKALVVKDNEFVAKYYTVLEHAYKTNLLDTVIELIRKGQTQKATA